MASLDALLSYVTEDIPAAPREVVRRALNRAARDLLMFSTVWRSTLAPQAVAAGTSETTISVPQGQEVVLLDRAWWGARPLVVTTPQVADERYAESPAGEPVALAVLNPTTVRLLPVPVSDGQLKCTLALANTIDTGEVPDFVVQRYSEGIAAGAKRLLCLQPGRAWTSAPNAMLYQGLFRDECSRARRDAETAYGAAQSRVQLRSWV